MSSQTSDNIFAVRSFALLCLIDIKHHFLQFMQCCILNLLSKGHFAGKFGMLHPYRKRIVSHKCYYDSSKPTFFIGIAVSQFATPLSMLISSNFLDFSDRWFLNWFKLVWHRYSFSFLMNCLATLIWVLSIAYCLLWFLIRGVSWGGSFLSCYILLWVAHKKIGILSPPKRVAKDRHFRSVSLHMRLSVIAGINVLQIISSNGFRWWLISVIVHIK